jgi:hypothetical protein
VYERQILSYLVGLIVYGDYDRKNYVALGAVRFGCKRLAAEPAMPAVLAQRMHNGLN